MKLALIMAGGAFIAKRTIFPLLAVTAVTLGLLTPALGAAPAASPAVLHQGVLTRQDIPARGGSEPDTVAEPDVAVSPRNPEIAVAAAQDSRFADGGAVTISVAWTSDGGASWHHQPVRGIARATGGAYPRASDPVVAFGPDGTAYLSLLLRSAASECATAVAVLRSGDGGRTWSRPSYVHRGSCNFVDDKDWLVVDTARSSPHRGRLYDFWTAAVFPGGHLVGDPEVVRWSDDKGRTWSKTTYVTAKNLNTENSQPMILPSGEIVDTFYNFGSSSDNLGALAGVSNTAPDDVPVDRPNVVGPAAIDAFGSIFAAHSNTGGRTWSRPVEVTNNGAGSPPDVRCCLFQADIDPVTHLMYVAWEGGVGNTDPVYIAWSRHGTQWSSPIRVSRGDRNGVQRVNVDVVARRGRVYVTYGTRTQMRDHGGIVQQQLSVSRNRGDNFGRPSSLGPLSVLRYSARAGSILTGTEFFPGDYVGAAVSAHRLYLVWAVSSKPRHPGRYHQVIYGATLRY